MKYDELMKVMEFSQPMSKHCDLAFSVCQLQLLKPKSILELGTGRGDWIYHVANSLQDSSIQFLGYEDFSQYNEPYMDRYKKENDWSDKYKLHGTIQKKLSSVNLNNQVVIRDADITTINPVVDYSGYVFDMVRLDCLTEKSEILRVLRDIFPYTHDKTVFVIDDINVNSCPNRFLAMVDLCSEGLLKPLHIGSKESTWVKSDYDIGDYRSRIEDKLITETHWGQFFTYIFCGAEHTWHSIDDPR